LVYCARHFVFVQTPWHFSANLQTSSAKSSRSATSSGASHLLAQKTRKFPKEKLRVKMPWRQFYGLCGACPPAGTLRVLASQPLQSRLGLICNNLNTGGWKLQAVTLNCYATFARTCYECGFRVCVSFHFCFGQILNQVQNDGWQGAFL